METFLDQNGGTVRLSFVRDAFSQKPRHVLVICKMGDKWLLTNHLKRGLEFPGGKVEQDESLEEAAKREVFEETGGKIKEIHFIGEYEVSDKDLSFVKAIYFSLIEELEERDHYFETAGPVFIKGDILELRWQPQFSFIMKDSVIEKSIKKILERGVS